MEHSNEIVSWAVGLPSIGVIIAYGWSIIRRRISADKKAVDEDNQYTSMLDAYRKERDGIKDDRDKTIARMVIIEAERNEAVSLVGKLGAEVKFLSIQVTELKIMVEKLAASLEVSRTEIHELAIENVRLFSQRRVDENCQNRIPPKRTRITKRSLVDEGVDEEDAIS